jgi:hypothetical protein
MARLNHPVFVAGKPQLTPEARETYVVTVGVGFADGKQPECMIHEIFRGDHDACVAVMNHVSTPSHDKRDIASWWMQFSKADDWEAYVRSF